MNMDDVAAIFRRDREAAVRMITDALNQHARAQLKLMIESGLTPEEIGALREQNDEANERLVRQYVDDLCDGSAGAVLH